MKYQIIPTIWEEEFDKVVAKMQQVEGVADRVLFDIMDGKFVRKRSWDDPAQLKTVKIDLAYDVHLYVSKPEEVYFDWIKGGCGRIIFHYEAMKDKPKVKDEHGRKIDAIRYLIKEIHSFKRDAGIALLPATDWQPIIDYMEEIDYVVLMTAKTWIKRKKFLDKVLNRVKSLRKFYQDLDIAVEGCLDQETLEQVFKAGANIFYVGDYLWEAENCREAFEGLKEIITEEKE